MSLIADALKAAQREKERRNATTRPESLRTFLSFRGRGSSVRSVPRSVTLAAALFLGMLTVLITVIVLTSRKRGGSEQMAIAEAQRAAPATTVQTPAAIPSEPEPALFGAPSGDPASGDDTPLAAAPYRIPTVEDPLPPQSSSDDVESDAPASGGRAEASAPAAPRTAPQPSGNFRITMQPATSPQVNPYIQQAYAAQRRGNLVDAKDLYEKALLLSPNDAQLHNNLGALYRSLGDLQSAEDAYRKALSLDRNLASAWSNLGVVLDARGRKRDATAAFQEALRLEPNNAATKVNLALQYHAAGLLPDARKLLDEALAREPSLAEGHYALARLLEDQGDRAGATREYGLFLSTSGGRFTELEERVRKHVQELTNGAR